MQFKMANSNLRKTQDKKSQKILSTQCLQGFIKGNTFFAGIMV